jgi:hypothetical protein
VFRLGGLRVLVVFSLVIPGASAFTALARIAVAPPCGALVGRGRHLEPPPSLLDLRRRPAFHLVQCCAAAQAEPYTLAGAARSTDSGGGLVWPTSCAVCRLGSHFATVLVSVEAALTTN